MEIKEALVDKRRKIPQTKIILHFFAGNCKTETAFMSYESQDRSAQKSLAQKMLQMIQKALEKKRQAVPTLFRNQSKILKGSFRLSKKGNGINIFNIDCDEI